jgi:hypothetical protein
MAHNIFQDRFYSNRQKAWHGIGYVSETDQTGIEALTAIGGGYYFEKRPLTVTLNGKAIETEDFAIVRSPLPDDPTERIFGYATKRYTILQPLEVIELFDEKVKEPVETLGFLGKGERMFMTWKMPKFDVVKDDTVELFGTIVVGFDALLGASLLNVTTRSVCENTVALALREADNTKEIGRGRIYSGKHTTKSMKYEFSEWMGYIQDNAKKQANLAKSLFKRLAQVPLEEENEVYRLLFAAYPNPEPLAKNAYIPPSLRQKEEEKIEDKKELMEKYRSGIHSLFTSGQGTAISKNYWGLLNATTEYFNWGQMEKKPANASILFGQRSNRMNDMVEVLDVESQRKLAK